MNFLYVKALHIIFVVTWFSGMFYLCRLFIYMREACDKSEAEREILHRQLGIMSKRLLYGITWPSAILTLIFGLYLLYLYPTTEIWMYIKLGLVVLLFAYHISLHMIYRQQSLGQFRHSSNGLRIWNEIPTLFLVSIVMLVVVKQSLSPLYGILGLVSVAAGLMIGIRIYKRLRR